MDLLIILIVVLTISALIYLFYPSIKRIFFSKDKKAKSNNSRSESANKRVERRLEKIDAKKQKRAEKKENNKKDYNDSTKKIEIVENDGDLFAEKIEKTEDPDTKVNYENFDLDGLFEKDSKNENIINLKNDKNEEEKDDNVYSENFEDIFNEYFANNKEKIENKINDKFNKSFSNNKREEIRPKRNIFNLNSNKNIDSDSEEELFDFLQENMSPSEESDIKRQFDNMPNEIKVLILSNLLDKKDI